MDARRVHYESISVVGSSGSDPSDMSQAMDMIADGRIRPGNYVAAVGGLDAARDLLDAVRAQRMEGKGIIYPSMHKPLEEIDGWSPAQERELLRG